MSDQEPGPSQNPYGQSQPANPYGQPSSTPNPYGEQPAPQPYGGQQQPYGGPVATSGDPRPGTVTAAGWITIVLSGLSAALFAIGALLFVVARDSIVNEMERVPEFEQANIDPDSVVGVMVAFMLMLVIWAVISVVLGVFVLRRSNVARILLVISSVVTALGSLLLIASGISAVWLIAAIAVIVMLFIGGAGDWFNRTPSQPYDGGPGGPGGYDHGGQQPGSPYGDQTYGTPPPPEQGQGGTPPPPEQGQGGTDYPPPTYPGR